jgi:hypothetical protein
MSLYNWALGIAGVSGVVFMVCVLGPNRDLSQQEATYESARQLHDLVAAELQTRGAVFTLGPDGGQANNGYQWTYRHWLPAEALAPERSTRSASAR